MSSITEFDWRNIQVEEEQGDITRAMLVDHFGSTPDGSLLAGIYIRVCEDEWHGPTILWVTHAGFKSYQKFTLFQYKNNGFENALLRVSKQIADHIRQSWHDRD